MHKKLLVLALFMLPILATFAYATPWDPESITIGNNTRRAAASALTVNALAGNVTQLTIDGTTITQAWQGYHGNVSGAITLDDVNNKTMYDWAFGTVTGEVYAANSTVTFTAGNVECYNFTNTTASYANLTDVEAANNIASGDGDGLDETFSYDTVANYGAFSVGSDAISGSCPAAYIYDESEASDTGQFPELLLYDITNNNLVFTAKIEATDNTGFDGQEYQFEMLVLEDGHAGDTSTTPYYFYVELA